MTNKIRKLFVLVVIFCLILPTAVSAQPRAETNAAINFTILHTNDFHGQLEGAGSNPGSPSVAYTINGVRTAVGAANVLLVDAGDEMQGSLLSNLQKGEPTIAVYNAMGYNAATFGNHEFDWGQTVLGTRKTEAAYPYVTANIVKGACAADNWTPPDFAQPFVVQTVGTAPNTVRVALIGVTTTETPVITSASSTQNLCFKDPYDSILHYYDTLKAQADVIVVLSHLGYTDGGYGYGIPAYGDQTLATKLITAGKVVPLIIGGHTHTDLSAAKVVTVTGKSGQTTVVQAHYNGRKVGRADLTYDSATGGVTVAWTRLVVPTSTAKPNEPAGATEDATIKSLIQTYSSNPDYQTLVTTPIGYSAIDLPRLGGKVDNMMGTFVDDAIYNALNSDADPTNDVDMFFNNAGGIRTDWCAVADPANPGHLKWDNATGVVCSTGTHEPVLLTFGDMFTILPFGNQTVVGTMTGAQIMEMINQGPTVSNGVIQPAGFKYKYYAYKDTNPGPQPYAWGAFEPCVVNKTTKACDALDLTKTYKVGTNEFLAPAGQDGFKGFKYMTGVTYWGDMLDAVNSWVATNYTLADPYKGPNGDGTLDGRIARDGTDTPDSGSILPVTILHHNDSHGRLLMSGSNPGFSQLVTLIKQERLHNPGRTLLFSLGDNIQGDSMMYYFKGAGLGYASDGTALASGLRINPIIAAMNAVQYDGMVLGNHEFNFGSQIFTGTFSQAAFPLLGANLSDDGAYGINKVEATGALSTDALKINVHDYLEYTLPSKDPANPINLAVLGLTNHRVPNYELPSNIPGLTFSNPLDTAASLVPDLKANNDAIVALTHIGLAEDPKSVEVDKNVDVELAKQTAGIDAIIGGHSHSDPSGAYLVDPFKYLPTLITNPDKQPILITQANRYNTYLGEVILGLRAKAGGGYEVVTRAGQYLAVTTSLTEDAQIKAVVDPYNALLTTYNNLPLGSTTAPIDALTAFTQETTGANLQADAAVWELGQHGITVDFHLSGAMTNKKVADTATLSSPFALKVADMFTVMPYENSLVVLSMNGPQLKTVLERGYRNYYYYKYVPGYGGYSYYTTCMIDINKVGKITYSDTYPRLPNGNNVVSLEFNGKKVDFKDAQTYYKVSTVNYLAAGSCNMNDSGATLWPLNQTLHDTQYYVRDAVIDYVKAMGTVSPAVEGRLNFLGLVNSYFMPMIGR